MIQKRTIFSVLKIMQIRYRSRGRDNDQNRINNTVIVTRTDTGGRRSFHSMGLYVVGRTADGPVVGCSDLAQCASAAGHGDA